MACTRVVLYLTVIHGGKVIVLVLHSMSGDAMRHLRSGVIVQRRVICHHAAKQRHVHRGRCFQGIPILLFIRRALHSQLCQRLCLRSAHEEQRLGALIVALDTGSPKTAVYGGVLRARVSSQAWKHAMRAAFAENARLDVGKRTKKAAELVKAQILALAQEQIGRAHV